MWSRVLLALTAICFVAAAALSVDEPIYRVHASLAKNNALIPLLQQLDYKQHGGFVEIFLSEKERELLEHAKISFEIKEIAQPLLKKLQALPDGYSTLDEIWSFLELTVRTYPNIAQLVDSPGTTFEGRKLPIIKISGNVSIEQDEPAILINSNIHAREIVTPVLTTEIIRRLTSTYATDANIRAIVDNNAIFVMPSINPDGYEYVWQVNNMWRKNRKLNRDGSFGVDCNRNFDLGWSSSCSGSSIPASDTYKGASAGSEEETQIVKAFSVQYNLAKMIDFHSSGREVVYSYQCTPLTKALDDYIIAEGEELADLANYAARRPAADGQHQEWTIANVTAYSYLVETELEFQPSYQRALAEFERIWPLAKRALERLIPLSGHIKLNNNPVAATIQVVQFNGDVTWHSEPRYGSYHLFLPDGTWTLAVSADGASTKTVSVTINNAVASVLNIAL